MKSNIFYLYANPARFAKISTAILITLASLQQSLAAAPGQVNNPAVSEPPAAITGTSINGPKAAKGSSTATASTTNDGIFSKYQQQLGENFMQDLAQVLAQQKTALKESRRLLRSGKASMTRAKEEIEARQLAITEIGKTAITAK